MSRDRQSPTGRTIIVEFRRQAPPIRTAEAKQLRSAFAYRDESAILGADYSDIEHRVLATLGEIDAAKKARRR